MGRNPGKLVKHEDGRRGIVYNSDQERMPTKFRGKNKVMVRWWADDGSHIKKEKSVVSADKLTITGYVD